MGDTFDVSHYLGVFIEEAKEHIESLEENLVKLEKEPYNQDLIQLFSALSTLLKALLVLWVSADDRISSPLGKSFRQGASGGNVC